MYTFISNKAVVVSNLVEIDYANITVHSMKPGHDLVIHGDSKELQRLYEIICNTITANKSVINLIDIKEHFCLSVEF